MLQITIKYSWYEIFIIYKYFIFFAACTNKEELKREIKEELKQEMIESIPKIKKGDGSWFYNVNDNAKSHQIIIHNEPVRKST